MSRRGKAVEVIDEANLDDAAPNPRRSRKRPADDEDVVEVVNVEPLAVLPRHAQRAIRSVLENNEDFEEDLVVAAVKAYCKQNPNTYNIDEVAGGALGMLLDGFAGEPAVPGGAGAATSSSSNGNGKIGTDNDTMDVIEEPNPIQEILSIFPDANVKELETLLDRFREDVEQTVQHMMEKGYEKTKKTASPLKRSAPEKDYTSSSWETSTQYRLDAAVELVNNFPFVTKASLEKVLKSEKNHYFHALKKLEEWTKVVPRLNFRGDNFVSSLQYSKEDIAKIKASLEESAASISLILRMAAKNLPRPSYDIDEVLEAEIAYIRRKRAEESELKDKKIAEELNFQLAEEEHALMECGCCYSEYPFESLVQCSEAHLFCKECLQRYAEQTVFGDGRSTLKCMHSSGAEQCPGVFTETMLRQSLPEKVLSKYSEAQTRDVLKAAAIEDMVSCHHCDFQAIMGEDAGKVLHCPMCEKDTCRECGEVAHIPLKCSEVEKKSDTHKRKTVEEALTQARVRTCPNPKCKTKFFKVEGCNKMTCTCGSLICYICREDITKIGYAHFCQIAHCDHKHCGRCKLFTNTVEDDNRAMRDAGLQTLKQLQEEGKEEAGGNGGGEGPKIELEKYLENVPQPVRPFGVPQAPPAVGGGFGFGGFQFGFWPGGRPPPPPPPQYHYRPAARKRRRR